MEATLIEYAVLMLSHIAKQIFEAVIKAEHILLIPHQHPDGDALGSSSAFLLWLESINKNYTFFCKTPASQRLSHLPLEKLSSDPKIWNNSYDLVMVFDSGDLCYAGVDYEIKQIRDRIILINFDHHPTNKYYGDINFVDSKSSSTAEMVERFFFMNHIEVSRDMATSLLTGFVTDTENFTNGATSGFAMSAASQLLKNGGKMEPTQERVYKNISIASLKVWGKMMERMKLHETLDIVYTFVTQEDLSSAKITETEIEGLANFMNTIEEGKIKLILKEKGKQQWKGSFRTTRDDIDVSAYAQAFSGGGHKKAAGFAVEGTIDEALAKIFTVIIH